MTQEQSEAREMVMVAREALLEVGVDLALALEVAGDLVPAVDALGETREQAMGIVEVLRAESKEWGLAATILLVCHTLEVSQCRRCQ